MKIGYILSRDPFTNKRYWSGTAYKAREAIENAGFEVVHISAKVSFWPKVFHVFLKFYAKICKKNAYSFYTFFFARYFAKVVEKNIPKDVDLLFVPAYTSFFAYVHTDKPIIFFTDSTFKLNTSDYYKYMSNLLEFNQSQGNQIEQSAFDKCAKIICASDWAKKSIIHDYHQDPSKVHILELGANIDAHDIVKTKSFNKDGLDLLFLAVEWERKGGDIAVECCKYLNSLGIHTTLHIVGIIPPVEYKDVSEIKVYGFLNKNDEQQYHQLISIIKQCDLLLLPTSAEAAGIVFAEAAGYGLPSFTYDTGGVGNYVINGVTGYRLNLNEGGKEFALKIKECLDENEFPILKERCLKYYRERLNWGVWSEGFAQIVRELQISKSDI